MWKRLQGHGRDKGKQIGNPVLLETTYDEDQIRHIPIAQAQNANFQPNYEFPATSPRYYDHLSPNDPRYRASEVPTVSSVYSQQSPDFIYRGRNDISPPSSPEPESARGDAEQLRRFRSMRDVSPPDESRSQMSSSMKTSSNIPVLRKAPPALKEESEEPPAQKFWGGKVAPNSKVRWDEYSGEPTSSNTGKAGQVNPGTYAKEAVSSERPPMGYQVSVTGGHGITKKNTTLSDRSTRFGTRPSPVDTTLATPRQPWKGASGRVEIVQPLNDQPSKDPLKFQRKSESPQFAGFAQNAPNSAVAALRSGAVPDDTPPVAEPHDEFDTHDNPIKPTVPLKAGKNSPPRGIVSPMTPHNLEKSTLASPISLHSPANAAEYSYPSPHAPTNTQTSTANPIHGQGSTKLETIPEPSTPPDTKAVRQSIEGTPGSTASRDNGPSSRFSWTTYNTNTTYQHSPPPSPPPPLPNTTPILEQEPVPVAASILNRRRPVPVADKLPARKPLSAASSRRVTMASSDPPSPRPSSTFSTSTQKALPRPPTEITAADHIDILEAQLDDLRVRRSNVHRLLQDLYNAAPPNPLITDFRRARLAEKRKKDFEDELAEIRREEHDVGLKLHRAWRKREKADPNGSESALWIRRVTS